MKMVDMSLTRKEKTEAITPKSIKGPDYPYGLTLRLDQEQIKKLGFGEGYAVGDECQVVCHAKVTSKSKHERKDGEGSESIELQITKMGVGPIEQDKPTDQLTMDEYAKRRMQGFNRILKAR